MKKLKKPERLSVGNIRLLKYLKMYMISGTQKNQALKKMQPGKIQLKAIKINTPMIH
jgi:hypothetical protein